MQYWTKNKPTTTGYYWVKFNEDNTAIAYVSISDVSYVTIEDETLNMEHYRLKNVFWSDNKIQEPIGLKI